MPTQTRADGRWMNGWAKGCSAASRGSGGGGKHGLQRRSTQSKRCRCHAPRGCMCPTPERERVDKRGEEKRDGCLSGAKLRAVLVHEHGTAARVTILPFPRAFPLYSISCGALIVSSFPFRTICSLLFIRPVQYGTIHILSSPPAPVPCDDRRPFSRFDSDIWIFDTFLTGLDAHCLAFLSVHGYNISLH
jgi:hypothetical protein